MEDISCPVCFDVFLAQSAVGDRRPNIICSNGHSVCTDCYTKLQENDSPCCPSCRDQLLPTAIINRTLLDAIEYYVNSHDQVPESKAGEINVGADEINVDEITMSESPFAGGAYADVYDAKWHSQDVVVKVLRSIPDMEKYTKQLQMEANLTIGLHHPNIVRLFGTTKLSGNRLGIVMEKVDNGSLDRFIGKLDHLVAVSIALGVVDGLEYMHSRKVVHRDLKPPNILLCGPQMSPKIADFGVSKVVQTILINTATLGTPKYTAPELMQSSDGHQYGCSTDIYSLSIILFELFSGQLAEKDLGTTVLQIVMAVVVQGKRPKIPANFPPVLRSLVERGWDQDPKKRPSLAEFRCALQSMPQRTSGSRQVSEDRQVLMIQQSAEVARVSFPLPVMSLKWKTSCEVLNSQALRLQMVANIKDKSNMARIINDSVLSVLKVVPRHLFLEERRLGGIFNFIKGNSQQDVINAAYLYNKAIPATMNSNESAPEIIGTQLSLTEIVPGQSVLLVGIKGGYIQSLLMHSWLALTGRWLL